MCYKHFLFTYQVFLIYDKPMKLLEHVYISQSTINHKNHILKHLISSSLSLK